MPGVLKARTAVGPDVWRPVGAGVTGVLVPRTTVYAADATWTKPAGLVYIDVEAQGGGGGSGGCPLTAASQGASGGAGGGGGYARKTIMAADLPATQAIVVGAGGAAGTTTTSGGAGELSSFGTVIGNGGGGGTFGVVRATAGYSANGGQGGVSSGGDINIQGNYGGSGIVNYQTAVARSKGGGSVLGPEGDDNGNTSGAAGSAGRPHGGGAGGGFNCQSQGTAKAGAAGAAGCVIVTEWVQVTAADGLTQAGADARYVELTGDVMSGGLDGVHFRSFNTVTINLDTAFYLEFTSEARGLIVLSGNIASAGNAMVMFRTGASAQCSLMSSVGVTVTCGVGVPLTGTTGVSGQLTFRTVTTENRLYIENRTGGARGYAGTFLAMTASGGGFTLGYV